MSFTLGLLKNVELPTQGTDLRKVNTTGVFRIRKTHDH